ncbi:MAG: hypothetical protein GF398_05695 [Chitinivibrionales bacterium]|nr:hypothetical protein [Chitinivibrionales bacterium]
MPSVRQIRYFILVFLNYTIDGIRRWLLKKGLIKRAPWSTRIVVVSYPKSGRTWLHVMLDFLGINLRYRHDCASKLHSTAENFEVAIDKNYYAEKRVVFLFRDPRDVVVSSYYHTKHRKTGLFEGNLSEFIRHPKYGVRKILAYQSCWFRNSHIPKDFISVQYRDLKKSPTDSLQKIVTFTGAHTISRRKIRKTVDIFAFDNMKFFERAKLLKMRYGKILRPRDKGDKHSAKVRSGRIGGHRDVLSDGDIEYCNRVMQEFPELLHFYS